MPTTGQLDTTTLTGVLGRAATTRSTMWRGSCTRTEPTAGYEVTYTRDSYGRIATKTETHSGSTDLRC